jgi:hypothetical protein
VEPLSRQELETIIERDLPGHELASDDVERIDAASVEADEPGADIAALRERFLGKPASATDRSIEPTARPVNEHDLVVAVRPKAGANPYDASARPKTVVVSGRDKRVIGRQG